MEKMPLQIVLVLVNENVKNNLVLLSQLFNYNLKKVDLKYYKHEKTPKYNKNGLEQVAKKCRKMRCQIATSNTFIIVDDEK